MKLFYKITVLLLLMAASVAEAVGRGKEEPTVREQMEIIHLHYVLFLHLPLNSSSLEHGGQTLFKSLTLRVYLCI